MSVRPPILDDGVPYVITASDPSVEHLGHLLVGRLEIGITRLPNGEGGFHFFATPYRGTNLNSVALEDGPQVIGRAEGALFSQLLNKDGLDYASREHVQIICDEASGEITLVDLHSFNGTYFQLGEGVRSDPPLGRALAAGAGQRPRPVQAAPAVPAAADHGNRLEVFGRIPDGLPGEKDVVSDQMALLLAGVEQWGALRAGATRVGAVAFGAARKTQLVGPKADAVRTPFLGRLSDTGTSGVTYVRDTPAGTYLAVLDGIGWQGKAASRLARRIVADEMERWEVLGFARAEPMALFWRQLHDISRELQEAFPNKEGDTRATLVLVGEPDRVGRRQVWASGVGNTVAVVVKPDGGFDQLTVDDSPRGLIFQSNGTIERQSEKGGGTYSTVRHLPDGGPMEGRIPVVGFTYVTTIEEGDQIVIASTRLFGRDADEEPDLGLELALGGIGPFAHEPLTILRNLIGESKGTGDAIGLVYSATGASKYSGNHPGINDLLERPQELLPAATLRRLGIDITRPPGDLPDPS